MPRRKAQENTPPPDQNALMEMLRTMQGQLATLQAQVVKKDGPMPDAIRKALDIDDPESARTAARESARLKRLMEKDMVEWVATRDGPVNIEGNTYDFKNGETVRVPRAVVEVVRQSDEQTSYAQRLSDMAMQKGEMRR